MSNPGPPGGDERPLAGPDAGMGLPESGTQHATSTDFALPVEAAGEPEPLTSGGPVGEARPPVPPAYEDPSELVDPAAPAYEEPTDLLAAVPEAEATALGAAGTPAYDALAAETRFGEPAPKPGGGLLAQVKAFADERPAAFLGAALVAGWLVGKLLSSSDDDED
ncbi:MAG: hypothetical protein ACJ73E_07005 [Mycobacteriales bacterium]